MDRRKFICAGAGTMITAVAGCSGGGNGTTSPDDTEADMATQGSQSLEDIINNGVVDYSALTDGDGSVSDSGVTIEYSSPNVWLRVEAFVDGNREIPDDTEFRVNPDLSSDEPTIFFAPVAREDESTWDFHVFANTAFVDRHDWEVTRTNEDGVSGGIDVEFSQVTGPVHHFVVSGTPDGSRGVLVSTQSANDIAENGVNGTGFNFIWSEPPEETETDQSGGPNAIFSFDHDQSEQTLTIVHDGGDPVPVSDLVVKVDRNVVDTAFNNVEGDAVTAGTSTTIDISEYADSSSDETTVRVIWMGDGDSATLAQSSL